MSTREALARLLEEWGAGEDCGGCADAILAEFLVIPRSDIVGTEYGWCRAEGDVEINAPDLDELRGYIRNLTGEDRGLYFEHLTRRLPWSPLPENGDQP